MRYLKRFVAAVVVVLALGTLACSSSDGGVLSPTSSDGRNNLDPVNVSEPRQANGAVEVQHQNGL